MPLLIGVDGTERLSARPSASCYLSRLSGGEPTSGLTAFIINSLSRLSGGERCEARRWGAETSLSRLSGGEH